MKMERGGGGGPFFAPIREKSVLMVSLFRRRREGGLTAKSRSREEGVRADRAEFFRLCLEMRNRRSHVREGKREERRRQKTGLRSGGKERVVELLMIRLLLDSPSISDTQIERVLPLRSVMDCVMFLRQESGAQLMISNAISRFISRGAEPLMGSPHTTSRSPPPPVYSIKARESERAH